MQKEIYNGKESCATYGEFLESLEEFNAEPLSIMDKGLTPKWHCYHLSPHIVTLLIKPVIKPVKKRFSNKKVTIFEARGNKEDVGEVERIIRNEIKRRECLFN
ncbi:MAG TPA: hypothetical protein VMV95_02485 [Bacillota bacterium]|nr:hypothetical protein [Bacillota bacterium]